MLKKGQFAREKSYSFDEGTRIAVLEQIYSVFRPLEQDDGRQLGQQEFIELCERTCRVVRSTPILQKYEALYQLRTEKGGQLTVWEAEQLLLYIFSNFPKR
jgi:hypothetical protein